MYLVVMHIERYHMYECHQEWKQLPQEIMPCIAHYGNINTRAQLSLGLADHTHGAHSQPASITVRV